MSLPGLEINQLLPLPGALALADIFEIEQSGVSYKATFTELQTLIGGGSQTPWLSNIDADNNTLENVKGIVFNDDVVPSATKNSVWSSTSGMNISVIGAADNVNFIIGGASQMAVNETNVGFFGNFLANVLHIESNILAHATGAFVNMAVSETIGWLDNAGTGNLFLGVNGSDQLIFDGVVVGGPSPLTTKGDLFTFTTVDARLPVGTNGQILSANSGETTGLEWIAAPGGGDMILAAAQIVTGAKTFLDTTFLLRNIANSANGSFVNTNTVDRIYTLQDKAGIVALQNDKLDVFAATTSAELATVISDETGSGLLVFGTSPTIVTPTIASFTNATHTHQNAAGAEQLVATLALTATGTKDSTTFLRGDDTWAVPPGGGITTLNTLTATTQTFAVAQADELAISSVTSTHTFSVGANIPRLDAIQSFTAANEFQSSTTFLNDITLQSSASPPLKITKTGTATNTSIEVLHLEHQTTGDMVAGFGSHISFYIDDGATSDIEIARIGAVREGADNSGTFVVQTANAGVFNDVLTIGSDGEVNWPQLGGNINFVLDVDLTGNDITNLANANMKTGVFAAFTGIGPQSQTLDMNGNIILLSTGQQISRDPDGIIFTVPTADQYDFVINVNPVFTITAAGLENVTFNANGTGNSISNIDVADLANGTDGELITWDAAGAPATVAVGTATHVLTSNGPGTAPTFQVSPSGFADPMTTRGDIIIRNASNVTDRLAIGANTFVLTSDGTDIAWAASGAGSSPPFDDATAILKGSVDDTKLLRFEVDGFTTATTRVITPPNQDIVLAGINISNTWTQDQVIQTAGALTQLTMISDGDTILHIRASSATLTGHTQFERTRGSDFIPTNVLTGDNLGEIQWFGRVTSLVEFGSLFVEPSSTSPVDGVMLFQLADAGTVGTKLTLQKTGNLIMTGDLDIAGGNILNTGTLTLPTSTDTLVGRDTTDTLTLKTLTTPTIVATGFTNMQHTHQAANTGGQLVATLALTATGTKDSTTFLRGDDTWAIPPGSGGLPVVDTTSIVEGSADATKEMRFEVDGLTTATIRVMTIPDKDMTLAGTNDNLGAFAATTSAQLLGVISDETGSGLLVFGTSPIIVTPTIASFVNAVHDHEAAAGGGQLTATAALDATGTKDSTTFLRGDDTWAIPTGSGSTGVNQTIVKTSDETNNTTTLILDSELVTSSLAIGTYTFEARFHIISNITADFQYTTGGTAVVAGQGRYGMTSWDDTTAVITTAITAATIATIPSSSRVMLVVTGHFEVTTAGTFGIEWAQVTGDAGPTTLLEGSSLTVKNTSSGGGANGPPFVDTQTIIEGSVDDTKLLRFEIDGFTTATTRVITPPDADITLVNTTDGQIRTANLVDDNVTYAKIQNVVANNVFLGNNAGAGGIVDELTGTEATAMLNVFTSSLKGLVPVATGGLSTEYLSADGTFTVPAGGGSGINDTIVKPGDQSKSTDTVVAIDDDLVTGSLAIGNYYFEALLLFDSSQNNIKYSWNSGSSTISGFYGQDPLSHANNSTAAATGITTQTVMSTGGVSSGSVAHFKISGFFEVTVAGTFALGWAQQTSLATATILKKGSTLTIKTTSSGSGVESSIGDHDQYLTAGYFNEVTAGVVSTRIMGTGDNRKAVAFYPFTNGVDEFIVGKWIPPTNYNGGTFTIIIDWTSETEGSGNVLWEVAAVFVTNGDDLTAAGTNYGTAVELTVDAQSTINFEEHTARSGAITPANTYVPGDAIYLRIQRLGADVSDTFTQIAQMMGVNMRITTDAAVAS